MKISLTHINVLYNEYPSSKKHVTFNITHFIISSLTSLVVYWSEFLTIYHEVPGSIPGFTMGIFP
jgi:hypothetical protein